jgi:hypothetical protein
LRSEIFHISGGVPDCKEEIQMKLETEWIQIEDEGRSMSAYQARGERAPENVPENLGV